MFVHVLIVPPTNVCLGANSSLVPTNLARASLRRGDFPSDRVGVSRLSLPRSRSLGEWVGSLQEAVLLNNPVVGIRFVEVQRA